MFWLLALLAYLLGSLSFAIVLSRLSGSPDPRSSGSGNAGATNMLRLAGRKMAILTLLGDLCKGLLPVLLARLAGLDLQEQAWVGVCAVLGHLFPVYFRFQGGKGVATVLPCCAAGHRCLAADVLPHPHQFAGSAGGHSADPATAGLART